MWIRNEENHSNCLFQKMPNNTDKYYFKCCRRFFKPYFCTELEWQEWTRHSSAEDGVAWGKHKTGNLGMNCYRAGRARASGSEIPGQCLCLSSCAVVCRLPCLALLSLFPWEEHLWSDPCHTETSRPCLNTSSTSSWRVCSSPVSLLCFRALRGLTEACRAGRFCEPNPAEGSEECLANIWC